jgi:hypothetical protein
MGYGSRLDFTKQETLGDFTLDYDRMLTLRQSLEISRNKATKLDTFGS